METFELQDSSVIEKALASNDRPERFYNVGDVVFANHVIVRQDEDDIWIAATHGMLGVVCAANHPNYAVSFIGTGCADVQTEDINPYQGAVVYR